MRVQDILNPKKWVIYARYLWQKHNGIRLHPDEALSWASQVMFRSLQCPQCLAAGKCIGDDESEGCGCKMPEALLDGKNWCSEGYWFEMLSTEEWEKEKIKLGLGFSVTYMPQIKSNDED